MGTATDVAAGISALVVSTLGATYTELAYGVDVARNRFNGGTLGYAVLAGELDQTDGVTRYVTVDQQFEVVLTETYGQSQVGDQAQRTAAHTLYGRIETLYKQIVANKAGVPALVMHVGTLSVSKPEFLDSNVAVVRATMIIKYRTAL